MCLHSWSYLWPNLVCPHPSCSKHLHLKGKLRVRTTIRTLILTTLVTWWIILDESLLSRTTPTVTANFSSPQNFHQCYWAFSSMLCWPLSFWTTCNAFINYRAQKPCIAETWTWFYYLGINFRYSCTSSCNLVSHFVFSNLKTPDWALSICFAPSLLLNIVMHTPPQGIVRALWNFLYVKKLASFT